VAIMDHSTARSVGIVASLLARLVRGAEAILRYWRNRRQFGRLAELSDRELADIGLERDDLHYAWKQRADTDPLRYLGSMARSRGTIEDAARRVA